MLPFETKNRPDRLPWLTILAIILFIGYHFLVSAQLDWAHGAARALQGLGNPQQTPVGQLSLLLIHKNVMLLFANVLALWLFGAALEGRLGTLRYILLLGASTLATCLTEYLLYDLLNLYNAPVMGFVGPIMGLAGATLWLFPYAEYGVLTFMGYFQNMGSGECNTSWAVGSWWGLSLFLTLAFNTYHGTSPISYIVVWLPPFFVGLLLIRVMGVHPDNELVSRARAAMSETNDYSALHLADMEALLQQNTEDMNLVMAYCEKLLLTRNQQKLQRCVSILSSYGPRLVERAEPTALAQAALALPVSSGGPPAIFYLHLASRLEKLGEYDLSAQLLRRICELQPGAPETETPLYRLARMTEERFRNLPAAQVLYTELIRLYPTGDWAYEARQSLNRLQGARLM